MILKIILMWIVHLIIKRGLMINNNYLWEITELCLIFCYYKNLNLINKYWNKTVVFLIKNINFDRNYIWSYP